MCVMFLLLLVNGVCDVPAVVSEVKSKNFNHPSQPTGQFNSANIRLINLRTWKGTPKHLCLQQRRQVMLHKDL